MKIEVGKYYVTRDGRKVRIYSDDNCGSYGNLIHGAVLGQCSNNWYMDCWNPDGASFERGSKCPSSIVGEWGEPKPRMIAWINTNGLIRLVPPDKSPDVYRTASWVNAQRAPWLDEPEG